MGRKKILVVDDEIDILEMIKDYLEHNEYDVLTASDGTLALELAVNEKPDLITLDIMMAQKDGYETCLLLKENQSTSTIPVIIVTGRGSQQAALAAQSFGADSYLSKPFQLKELGEQIEKLIG
ncbi:response regulator [bacterium]|nr:response regulator [bacterium]MCP5461809.1 response regulator [bacterium]